MSASILTLQASHSLDPVVNRWRTSTLETSSTENNPFNFQRAQSLVEQLANITGRDERVDMMHRIMCSIEAELGKMVPDAFGCDMLNTILPTEAMSFTQSGSKGKATEGGPEAATNVLSGNTRPVKQQLSVNGAERPSSNLTSAPQTTSKAKGKDPIRDSSSSTSNLSPEDLRPSKKRKVSRSIELPAREALSAQKHPEMASSKTTSGEPLASKKHEYSQNGDETSSKKSKKRRYEASVISG